MKDVLAVLVAVLTAGALISAGGVLVAVSAGAWGSPKPSIGEVSDLTRVISGAVSAFVFAVGVSLFTIRRQALGLGGDLAAIRTLVQPEIDRVLKRRESLDPWTEVTVGRKSIAISGMSLRTLSTENVDNLRDILNSGGRCRFLLIEPVSESSSVVARNLLRQDNPSEYNSTIKWSLERLGHLRDDFPTRAEIRTLNHVPASSITMLDHGLPNGKIFVEFYMYDVSSARRPHLELSAQNSPVWYGYFHDQFEKMWSAGKNWEPS